jgi:hypothetical protein
MRVPLLTAAAAVSLLLSFEVDGQTVRPRQSTVVVGDKWTLSVDKNPMNDRPIVTAVLRAEAPAQGWLTSAVPQLVVRCQTPRPDDILVRFEAEGGAVQPGLEVYVVTGMAATVENAEGKHTINVRFDSAPVQSWGTSESTDKKALFIAPIYATRIILTHHTFTESQRMLVEFTPFNASPVIIRFDVRGFEKHAAKILSACPVVDRSKWRYAPGQAPPKPATVQDLMGATTDYVLATIGDAVIVDGDSWTYRTTTAGTLVVTFVDGKVSDIQPNDLLLNAIKATARK